MSEEQKEAPKEATKAYVVTRRHTGNHQVGDTVQLTDKKAANWANKVRLKDEFDAQSKAGRKAAFENENIALKEENAQLKAENAQLKAGRG
jgi:hypothetical protein